MAVYDNNGTANAEIGKLYDNNGTTNSQIGKVYDNNGTTNSLIYEYNTVLFPPKTNWTVVKYYSSFHSGSVSDSSLYIYSSYSFACLRYNAIDLTPYKTIYFTVSSVAKGSGTGARIGVCKSVPTDSNYPNVWNNQSTQKQITAAGTYSFDISSLSGNYYPLLSAHSDGGGAANITVTNVWLEFK